MDVLLLIIIGVLSRLVPHPPNMTAVGALALFSGARLNTTKALCITAATMIVTDAVLGFHSVMWATYGCMLLAVILGRMIRNNRTATKVVSVTILSSVAFYLVTNFAVWAAPGSMYPKTIAGLVQSYVMAIPFFRNSLLGDIFYSGVFFSAYELVPYIRRNVLRFIFSLTS